jgi:hypothetical protein
MLSIKIWGGCDGQQPQIERVRTEAHKFSSGYSVFKDLTTSYYGAMPNLIFEKVGKSRQK